MSKQCEVCGRDDVELTLVRVGTWFCGRHLPLFTQHWHIAPNLQPFETSPTMNDEPLHPGSHEAPRDDAHRK